MPCSIKYKLWFQVISSKNTWLSLWFLGPFGLVLENIGCGRASSRLISLTRDAAITKKLSIFLFKKGKKRKRFIRQLEKLDHKLTVNLIWSSSEEEGDRVTVYYYSIYSARQIFSSKKKKKKCEGNALGSNTIDALGWALGGPNLVTRLPVTLESN